MIPATDRKTYCNETQTALYLLSLWVCWVELNLAQPRRNVFYQPVLWLGDVPECCLRPKSPLALWWLSSGSSAPQIASVHTKIREDRREGLWRHPNLIRTWGERWIDWCVSQRRKLDTNQRDEAQRVLSLHGKEALQQMHHRDGGEERHLLVGELRHAQWHSVDESKCLQASKTTRIVTPYGEKKLERVDVNYEFTTHENAILFRESKLACFPSAFMTGITKPLTWFRMPPRFEDRWRDDSQLCPFCYWDVKNDSTVMPISSSQGGRKGGAWDNVFASEFAPVAI